MDIDNDEKKTQRTSNMEKKARYKTQRSVISFRAENEEGQVFPKTKKIRITGALSDVRVK
jgi:phosphoribosylaminoimidazole carboxylase (NCAIR synthetase)